MKQTYNKILTTIKSSLDLLYNCRREKEIQNILATQLNTEVRIFKHFIILFETHTEKLLPLTAW